MKYFVKLMVLMLFSALLLACQPEVPAPPTITSVPVSPTAAVQDTPTPAPEPTATSLPLAAVVNNQGILLSEYQNELARYELSEQVVDEETARQILDNMIDELLLSQAAYQNGFQLDVEALQQRIDRLEEEAGGQQALQEWKAANLYSDEAFRSAVARAAAAAWMRDQAAAGVSEVVEQIHAREILLSSETQAVQILTQLQNGASFDTLAARQDPVTAGDLGWFPRGYLSEPTLEDAAFSLQPGEVSGVIASSLGYHIIQVIEREQRALDADARFVLQAQAVQNWLDDARSQAEIQIFLP